MCYSLKRKFYTLNIKKNKAASKICSTISSITGRQEKAYKISDDEVQDYIYDNMLKRIWRKRNPYALFVGLQIGTATIDRDIHTHRHIICIPCMCHVYATYTLYIPYIYNICHIYTTHRYHICVIYLYRNITLQ